MTTAKIFNSGNSQAIRIPKDFRFSDEEVGIVRVGGGLFLFPKNSAWDNFITSEPVSDDFDCSILSARQEDASDTLERPSI